MPRDSTRELLYIFNDKAFLSHNKLEVEPCWVSLWHNNVIKNPGTSYFLSAKISFFMMSPHNCSCSRSSICLLLHLKWKKVLTLNFYLIVALEHAGSGHSSCKCTRSPTQGLSILREGSFGLSIQCRASRQAGSLERSIHFQFTLLGVQPCRDTDLCRVLSYTPLLGWPWTLSSVLCTP